MTRETLRLMCVAGAASALLTTAAVAARQAAAPPAATSATPADRYVLPAGGGKKDGSSWANALDASAGGLQRGWDALAPGDTLRVGSGTYKGAGLVLRSGGQPGSYKTLAGEDTGGGLPVFQGTFDKARPDKTGETLVSAEAGTSHWWVRGLRAQNYRMGVVGAGRHQGIRIEDVDVSNCREGVSLDGGATPAEPDSGSRDVEIRDCEFQNYTKRGVRLKNGNRDVRVVRCVADAGGKAWATEPFQIGFHVIGAPRVEKGEAPKGVPDRSITFLDCVARNHYDDQGGSADKYWNADGFCAEGGNRDIRYVRCRAFDNTDGGWDDKSENAVLIDCVALRNKRNFRFWGDATLENCLSAYAVKPGGTGGASGLWASGTVRARDCTFFNDPTAVSAEKGKVELLRCIVSRDAAGEGGLVSASEGGNVRTIDSTLAGGKNSPAPRLIAARADWDGLTPPDAFDPVGGVPASRGFRAGRAAKTAR